MDTYRLRYCVDNDEGFYLVVDDFEEEFEGTRTELKDHLKNIRETGGYAIDVTRVDDINELW